MAGTTLYKTSREKERSILQINPPRAASEKPTIRARGVIFCDNATSSAEWNDGRARKYRQVISKYLPEQISSRVCYSPAMRTSAAAPSASLEEEAAVMVPFFRSNKVGNDCMAASSILSASDQWKKSIHGDTPV